MNVIDFTSARNSPKRSVNRPIPHYQHTDRPTRKVTFLSQISICPSLVTSDKITQLQKFVQTELDGKITFTYCGDKNIMKVVYAALEPLPHMLTQLTEFSIN